MRPSWIEIDLGAIRSNVRAIREAIKPADVCAVVKADGYGHGHAQVAGAALAGGAERLAVAAADEARALRHAGVEAPILVTAGFERR